METIEMPVTTSPTYRDIWQTLNKVDVTKHIEKKNGLSYLSWAWAWGVLMEHYPDADYGFWHEEHQDGTVTVYCTVSIGTCERTMWLPCMDYKNQAVKNPDARKLSDTKMRCLVKCLAMFGLGHHIYAGEDVPQEQPKMIHNPLDRDNLTVNSEHEEYAKAFRDAATRDQVKAVHADCMAEGEEFYRSVWKLLDSKTRSYIKKSLAEAA